MLPAEKFHEKIAKWLSQQPFWHGYLPREDLPFILKKKGDYIVRAHERPGEHGVKMKEYVLSIAWPLLPVAILDKNDIRSIAITRTSNRIYMDMAQQFASIEAMFDYYKTHPIVVLRTNVAMKLVRGVGLATWEFKHSHVQLGKKVGEGAYGEVFKSVVKRNKAKPFEAAIKTIRPETIITDEKGESGDLKMREVMAEARLMRLLNHPNIVRIRGIAVLEQPLYLIIDFMPGGGLDSYLKRHQNDLTMEQKNNMAISAAWGIEFVHSQDIIHRDIAARNCLYDQKNHVKLSDFGLARKGSAYRMKTRRKMPTKWLAPESLLKYKFYKASDVYTYGILLYEIYSCSDPYKSISTGDARTKICAGEFVDLNTYAPPELIKITKKMIFHVDHAKRSTMKEIVKALEEWLEVELILEADDQMEKQSQDSAVMNVTTVPESSVDKTLTGGGTKRMEIKIEPKASSGQGKKPSSINLGRRKGEPREMKENKDDEATKELERKEREKAKEKEKQAEKEKEEDSKCDETKKETKKETKSVTTSTPRTPKDEDIKNMVLAQIMEKTTDEREKDDLNPTSHPKSSPEPKKKNAGTPPNRKHSDNEDLNDAQEPSPKE